MKVQLKRETSNTNILGIDSRLLYRSCSQKLLYLASVFYMNFEDVRSKSDSVLEFMRSMFTLVILMPIWACKTWCNFGVIDENY